MDLDAQNPARFREDSPEVAELATGKSRVETVGRFSTYRLRNGWLATRSEPDSGWRDWARWTIAGERGTVIGGGEKRLTSAIANVLNFRR